MLVRVDRARYWNERLYKIGEVIDWPEGMELGSHLTPTAKRPDPAMPEPVRPVALSEMIQATPLPPSGGGPVLPGSESIPDHLRDGEI